MKRNLRVKFLHGHSLIAAATILMLAFFSSTAIAQSGHSLNYDPTAPNNDYAVIEGTDVIGTGSYTKEVWVRFASLSAATAYNILSQNNNASALYVYNNQFQAGQNPAGTPNVTDPTALTANVWYHVAVTYDATLSTNNMKLYKNGVLVSTGTAPAIATAGTQLAIGAFYTGSYGYGMNGDIDEVRIWNYARTGSQIAASYNCTVAPSDPNLTVYFDFEQGTANGDNTAITTIIDRSTHGNDATLHNFTLNGTTSNFTDATPTLTGECSVVPVRFASFDAKASGNSVKLHWQTATEINNAGFEIERSANGSNEWQSLGFVNGKGNSVSLNDYDFTDQHPSAGTNYYRLNQKDLDGNSLYSKVVSVSVASSSALKLYPTIAVSKINLTVPDRALLHTRYFIFDNNGKRVSEGIIKSTEQTIDVSNLNKGIYFLKVQNGGALKFLKQ